ncbi:hypothetical protein HBB16_06400 [Pseudonocardia sp. MCCB 268]|nr:hypothetical protein [Pseudonocardia cytotoxica]
MGLISSRRAVTAKGRRADRGAMSSATGARRTRRSRSISRQATSPNSWFDQSPRRRDPRREFSSNDGCATSRAAPAGVADARARRATGPSNRMSFSPQAVIETAFGGMSGSARRRGPARPDLAINAALLTTGCIAKVKQSKRIDSTGSFRRRCRRRAARPAH